MRRYLKHPDSFLQRFQSQIETWNLGRMLGEVTVLSQVLNHHTEALKRPQGNKEKLLGTQAGWQEGPVKDGDDEDQDQGDAAEQRMWWGGSGT